MNQKPSVSYPLQFAILIGLLGIFIVISAIIIPVLGSVLLHVSMLDVLPAMNKPENANVARLLNTIASLFAFFMPAVVLARILGKRPFTQLGFNNKASVKQLMLVIVITFASMVLSGALGELNERIPLPADLYAKAKKLEETYKAAMLSMATMRSLPEYFIALLVLAAFPALFEECTVSWRVSAGIYRVDKKQMGGHYHHQHPVQRYPFFLFRIFGKSGIGTGVGIDILQQPQYLAQYFPALPQQCRGCNPTLCSNPPG
jgi:hypothetical protein